MRNKYVNCISIGIVFLLSVMHHSVQAQAAGKKVSSTTASQKQTGCFDCDYLPLCNYDETMKFDGKEYRGVKNKWGAMYYYYCEKGTVTSKWYTSITPTGKSVDFDPFTNTQTTTYYQGSTQHTLHTRVILRANVTTGSTWESDGMQMTVIKKDTNISKGGAKYDNSIIVYDGSRYMYFAKGEGFFDILTPGEYAQQLNDNVAAKGTIDSDLTGTWYEYKGLSQFYLGSDGSGNNNVSSNSAQWMKWSVVDGMLCFSDEYGLKKLRLQKLSDGIIVNGILYKRKRWENPKLDTALNRQLYESRKFRFVAFNPIPGSFGQAKREKNEIVISGDSLTVSLPSFMTGPVAFTSTKFSYSVESADIYSRTIHITVTNGKNNLTIDMRAQIADRGCFVKITTDKDRGRDIYNGYITDMNGN